ncbi:hypothetical protein EDD22DRAFT_851761 [Suillus occidentalis]|nr:hypothetical protein EDD22DRAFT_851761 [Suillus occidentalis]
MTSQQNDPTTVSGSVADTRIDLAERHRQWAALREQHRQRWKFVEDNLWECTMKPEGGGVEAQEEVTSSKAFSVRNEVGNVADAVDGPVASIRPEHTKAVAGEDRAAVAGDGGSAVGIATATCIHEPQPSNGRGVRGSKSETEEVAHAVVARMDGCIRPTKRRRADCGPFILMQEFLYPDIVKRGDGSGRITAERCNCWVRVMSPRRYCRHGHSAVGAAGAVGAVVPVEAGMQKSLLLENAIGGR